MEVWQTIIKALSSGEMNFTRLYYRASNLRKEDKEKLSRETFSNTLKDLVKDGRVLRRENGRETIHSLNPFMIKKFGLDFILDRDAENVIEELGRETLRLEESSEITKSLKRDLPKRELNRIDKEITFLQIDIVNLIRFTLEMQSIAFFTLFAFSHFPSRRKIYEQQSKKCGEIIRRLYQVSKKIDITGKSPVLQILHEEIADRVAEAEMKFNTLRD